MGGARRGSTGPVVRTPRFSILGPGAPIYFPGSGLAKVPVVNRAPWGPKERGAYIKQWYDRGYGTPEGGWSAYDIHHIQPREYGGTNDFDNLVPIPRDVADAENLLRAAHAARSYSWRRPPRRSFRWMCRRVIAAGSVIGSGSGRIGRAFAIPR